MESSAWSLSTLAEDPVRLYRPSDHRMDHCMDHSALAVLRTDRTACRTRPGAGTLRQAFAESDYSPGARSSHGSYGPALWAEGFTRYQRGPIELRPIRSGQRGMHVPSLARSPRALHVAAPQVEAQLVSEQRENHLINGGAKPFGHWHADGRKMGDARAKSGLSSFSHVPNQIGCRNV